MDILSFLDFWFTSKIITQGYRHGWCKTGVKGSGPAACSQCLPSSPKAKRYRLARFQLVSKWPPLQNTVFYLWQMSLVFLSAVRMFYYLFLEFALFSTPSRLPTIVNPCIFLLLLCCLSLLGDREHGATGNKPCCISAKGLCWVVFKLSLSRSYPNPIKRVPQVIGISVRMEERVWALKGRKSKFKCQFCHLRAVTLGDT